ncbi:universal stress protein [Streptomyces sp. NPDC006627]|uniref:universal stress protein n=1 Tax=Streptomyces sp. NPDC006627 TaxID=3154679 RepID=UPI0033AC4D60
MSRTVTIGHDRSRESNAATEWAAREALRRAVPLRLLQVWSVDDPRTRLVDPATARGWGERALATAERRLRRRHPGLNVETAWVSGDPVEVLCAAADEADLLVLGSRGLGGVAGFLAGSVSLAVLARTQRPVVLVRPSSPSELEKDRSGGQIVLGLDVLAPSDELLAFGFAAADRYECDLRVVHSWALPAVHGPDMGGALPILMTEVAEDARRSLDETLAAWTQKFPGVPVVRDCRQGRPAEHLTELSHDARLVVVGRKVRHGRFGTHIGAVTHAVLHHSTAPVAVVPHD